MKKGRLGISTALTGVLMAGAVHAVEFDFDLALPADGFYSNATAVVSTQSYNGATFDLVYTIDSMANGSNSFARSTGTQIGVGSDTDIASHYTTIEGNDGEGLSFTGLTISNFVANDSGLELNDLTGLTFAGLSMNNVGNLRDGITVSFTNYSVSSVNYTLDAAGTGGANSYTLDLTGLGNYTPASTNLFIENDSANSADRWAVTGLVVSIDVPVDMNLPPVADGQNLTMLPDTNLVVILTGVDPEGSNLVYNIVDVPTNGGLSGATNTWLYTPTNNFQGVDSFTFTVSDGDLTSDPATVMISITNLLPTANAQSLNVLRNGSVSFTLTGSDSDGPSNLTFAVDDTLLGGTLEGDAPNLIYYPATDYVGEDSFTFAVNDGLADSVSATVTFTVLNNPPVADPKIVLTQPDTAAAVVLSGSDLEGSSLQFIVESLPAHGDLTGTEPNLSYMPTNGFTGTDTFTYSAYDGETTGAVSTVTILVSDDGFTLPFEDLSSTLSNNTLNVGGIPAEVTGVATNGNDYLYSAVFSGADLDGDGANDIIMFDMLVEAWVGGTITNTVPAANGGVFGTNGLAIIGTSNVPVAVATAPNGWGVTSGRLYAGETLEFTLMNFEVFLTDATQVGSATNTGFVGTHLQEIGNAHSHQTVIGEGVELFEVSWSDNDLHIGGFNTGSDPLIISQAQNYIAGHNKAFNWRIRDVDFGVSISLTKAGVPDVSMTMGSGGELVLNWEGGAAYNVLTNDNLNIADGWGVAVYGASAPVTNVIGSESQLFFRLGE